MISITKKQLILTIDENIIEKAKKTIPNISGFVENCLKQYLGIGMNLIHTSDMNKLVETISKCQLDLYLMNERGNIEEAKEKAKQDEILLAWRRVYASYRDTRVIDPHYFEKAIEVLGVEENQLKNIILMSYAFRNEIDVTDWETVYKEYGDDL